MNLLKKIQDQIDDILEYAGHYYFYSIFLMHIIYVFVFIGIISMNSLFLKTFNILIQTFVCVFLMFRFHPFRSHKLREYDAKIIFSSAGFLLFNMIFVEFFSVYTPINI
uniref:Uncharacterized protein n=1 Tax=viral metagenome TaxID=1070528 RepID=A0A6C0D2G3_9ZZZZ